MLKLIIKLFKKLFMRQEVRLFVEGREVEFATPPQILFTYTQNELTNPAVVKNSYTKTIKIEGTPNNNDIFGHIWDLSRIQSYGEGNYTQTLFNAAKKAEFTLFYNGEIYESGYLKLEKITKNGNHVTMDAVLYGGLGGFFYDLTYDNEGNKLKLSDLQYLENGGDSEFDMVISKETLLEAWNGIYDFGTKWAAVNFAPAYEGDPDNFDTDKCIVNFNNAAIFSAITSGETTYTANNGYSLGTLPEKMDMWATRDIRSYLVRPVLSVKYLFDAFVRYAASKGYELVLDSDFFNLDNPYYVDAWVTLPRLSEMKLTGSDTSSRAEITLSVNNTLTQNGWYNTTYRIGTDLPLGTTSIDLEMDFNVSGATTITQDLTTSAWIGGKRNFSGFAVQLIGFEGETTTSNIVTASTAYFLTSKVGDDYLKMEETNWRPQGAGGYKYDFGNWVLTGSGTWKWSNRLAFHMELPKTVGCFGLRIVAVANLETVQTNTGGSAQSYGTRRGKAYTSSQLNSSTKANTTTTKLDKNIIFNNGSLYSYSQNESAGFSGAHVGKKTMLNVDQTPCDWLLSYCKMFNLYFLKDPNNKKIQLLMRGNFYDTGTTVDVNDLIDRGSDIEITPIPYESMWYNLSQEQAAGGFAQQYENTFGTKYGTQRINTGYEFDVEEKKILDGNVFKSAVEGTEKSRYYLAPERFAPSNQMPAYILQGFKYLLYNGEQTYEVDMEQRAWQFKPLDKELYYDLFPKPQFRDGDRKAVDGKNVLLFFAGFKDCRNADGTEIPYWLTDDLGTMGTLNDQKPCWIYTEDEYDAKNKKIAIKVTQLPQFQRNMIGGSGNVWLSWDFGAPRQLFIDNAFWVNEAGIYYSFWRNYLKDFYSTDTRVVKCKMLIEKRPNPDMLRKFYWFDNARWRLNKIDEWNVSSHDTTSVEFVRVSDLEAYTSVPVTTTTTITVHLSKNTASKDGDTIEAYVHVSDGGGWDVEGYSEDLIDLSAMHGVGDTTVTITVHPNDSGSERELFIYFMADNSLAKVFITQAGDSPSSAAVATNYSLSEVYSLEEAKTL